MIRLLAGRLLTAVGLLALLSLLVFVGVDLLPGDPVTSRLGGSASPERIAEAQARLGLDQPLAQRYLEWVTGLLRGDLGTSATGRPVAQMLADRVPNSALLAGLTLALLVPLSLALGVWAGAGRRRWADHVVSGGALVLVAVPEFVTAGALVLLFSVGLGWLPPVSLIPLGAGPLAVPEVLVLPVLSLLLLALAYAVRVIRGATRAEVLRHGVLPAVLPVAVQVWVVSGVGLVGGAVLVESVFGYPGVGALLVGAVQTGDLPVVQALTMILGGGMLAALACADLAVRLLTPALRTAGTR